MKTETLQGLIEIVHENSIRKAAQNLHIPQQTLNKNITGMENELGVRILERTNHGVQLTDAGAEVYQFAKWCLHEYTELHHNLQHVEMLCTNMNPKNKIMIGCVNTAIQNIMSRVVANVYRSHNEFELSVVQDSSLQIIDKIMRDEYQIGIVLQYAGEQICHPTFDESLQFIPIYHSKPYAWVSRKSYLASQNYLSEDAFLQHGILRLKDSDEDMVNFVFQQNGLHRLNMILCENIYYATHMLNMNLGVVLDMKTNKYLNLEKSLSDIAIALPIRFQDAYQIVTGVLVKKEILQSASVQQVVDLIINRNNK